jgi:threonyl-tRNA synthetase
MKVHIVHAKDFWFKSNKPATKIRENSWSLDTPLSNTLVIFTTIEEGDEKVLSEILHSLINDIKKLVASLKPSSIVLYPYAHLSEDLAPPSKAIEILNKVYAKLKETLPDIRIEKAPFGWYKEFLLHCYGHPMSELSRRYGSYTKEDRERKQCFEINEAIEKLEVKPAYKDVFKRWGYLDRSGIFLVQLNSFISMMQSKLGDSLELHTISSCNTGEFLYNPESGPALIIDGNGYHYILAEKTVLVTTLNDIFEENISTKDGRIKLENIIIGECIEDRCLTRSLEEILVAKIYLALKKAEKGETPTLECWLAPCNFYIATATGSDEELSRAEEIARILESYGNSRICLDMRQIRLGRKFREAGRYWSNYTIIIGRNDLLKGIINVRDRKTGIQFTITTGNMGKELQAISGKCKTPIMYTKVIKD